MGQSGIDQLTREEGEEYIATARDSAEYETLRDTFTTEPRTRWTVYRVGTGEITRYICVFDIQNLEENTQGNTIIVIERNDIVHAEICLDHYTDDQIIQSEFITAEETRLESQSAEIIASSEKAGPADDDDDDIGSSSGTTISSAVSQCKLCKALVFAFQQTTQLTTGALCAMAASHLGPASVVAGTVCHQMAGKIINYLSKGGTTKSPQSVCNTLGYCP